MHADVSNETRLGLQGFQHVVYFCDTTFELVSPPLVKPGERAERACNSGEALLLRQRGSERTRESGKQ